MESRSKAFFINGGAGRVVCSIPAFEKYLEESEDKDFIIVCEGGTELYKGHPELDKRTFVNFIKAVIEGRGNDCAEMIFNLSKYEGNKLNKAGHTHYR